MNKKKLNILFLSSWYPNRVQPTLGNFIQKHAECVAPLVNVAVLNVVSDSNCSKTYEITKNTIQNVFTVIVYYKKTQNIFLKIFRYFKAQKKGLKEIDTYFENKIDLVHQNIIFPSGYFALKLKKKKGIPYIITEHWTGYLSAKKNPPGNFEMMITQKVAADASLITTVSKDLEKAMKSIGLSNKYSTIYNVVDTNLFNIKSDKQSNNKIKFLHISHLDDGHKNISGILNAIQKLSLKRSDFEFKIVGDGDTKPHELYAKELNILNSFVTFDGTKSTSEIASLLQQSDCFVLFSNYENLPVVIIEAMACGLPIISSNVGGIHEHINSNFGILVNPKDENELHHALSRMTDEIKNQKYNSEEIRNYAVENFSYEQIGQRFLNVYQSTIRNV